MASHVIIGGLLRLGMSAAAGVAFTALHWGCAQGCVCCPAPAGYVTAAAAGGALLYVIMMYEIAPLWNTKIVNFTQRVPFFLSHLLFGAAVGAWVYWKLGHAPCSAG